MNQIKQEFPIGCDIEILDGKNAEYYIGTWVEDRMHRLVGKVYCVDEYREIVRYDAESDSETYDEALVIFDEYGDRWIIDPRFAVKVKETEEQPVHILVSVDELF